MKILAPSLVILSLGMAVARAAPNPPQSQPPAPGTAREAAKPTAPPGASETRLLTGSYIPREFRQDGRITTGPNNVQIISARAIQLTGAATLSRALGVLGATH